MKNAAIPKVKRTPKELLMSVKEQLQFLKDFAVCMIMEIINMVF